MGQGEKRYADSQPADLAGSGFFGVFDGHGGQQCSSFVAKRLTEDFAVGSGRIGCRRNP